jgi:hypothetical protein
MTHYNFPSSSLLLKMPPVRSVRISSKTSCITHNRYDSHGKKIPTSTPSSRGSSIPSVTLAELSTYFDTAHDQLYDILDGDTELRRMVHAIEFLTTSNRALESIRRRQDQYLTSQFQLAMQNGLHGRLAPMLKRQRLLNRPPTPFDRPFPDDKSIDSYNTADHEYFANNEAYVNEWQTAIIDWDEKPVEFAAPPSPPSWMPIMDEYFPTPELATAMQTLEDRLSSPPPIPSSPPPPLPLTYVFNDPTFSSSVIIPTCGVCHSEDHHTPDCPSYVCFHCEVTQAGHYPAACPDYEDYDDAPLSPEL